jgi:hypothetical protein
MHLWGSSWIHSPSASPIGPSEAEVTQTPRHLIKLRGQKVTSRCSPFSGHSTVYWCQKAPGQGPQLLFGYYNELEQSKRNVPHRFSAQQFHDYRSRLSFSALELGDTGTYLCASSLAQPWRVTNVLCTNFLPSWDLTYLWGLRDSREKGQWSQVTVKCSLSFPDIQGQGYEC